MRVSIVFILTTCVVFLLGAPMAAADDYAGPGYVCSFNRQGVAAPGGVIATIELGETEAQTGLRCAQLCRERRGCLGFNQVHGAKRSYCELMSALASTSPFPAQAGVQFGAVCYHLGRYATRPEGRDPFPGWEPAPHPDTRIFEETRPGGSPGGKK